MAHYLNLYFPSTQDAKVIEIQDISLYDSNIDITNVSLKVNIPDCDTDFYPLFKSKGNTFLTSNSFSLTSADCKQDLSYLPDGIYSFVYSVCPNEQVFYSTQILRDQNTRKEVLTKLAPFYGSCENKAFDIYGKDITEKTKEKYQNFILILDIAQALTQDNRPGEAQLLLDYVSEQLSLC